MTGLLFGSFFVLMFLGVPIAVALGLAAVIAIVAGLNSSLIVTAQSMFNGINSFPLMAIPFFYPGRKHDGRRRDIQETGYIC